MSILVLLLLVALTSFVVAGCSGGGKEEGTTTGKAESASGEHAEHAEESEEETNNPGLLYTNNCGACHGHDGSGVVGPAIKGTALTIAQIEEKINNGSGNQMPKFKGGELKEEQIKLIANYVKDELK